MTWLQKRLVKMVAPMVFKYLRELVAKTPTKFDDRAVEVLEKLYAEFQKAL